MKKKPLKYFELRRTVMNGIENIVKDVMANKCCSCCVEPVDGSREQTEFALSWITAETLLTLSVDR